jgi:hypothetical protein
MKRIEENLLKLQKEVEEGVYRYRSDRYYINYNYLSDNTKKFLRRILRHILKLKGILKEKKRAIRLNWKKRKKRSQD